MNVINDPRVRKLSFTGSTQVGSVLLREAANTIVNCSMELGGNAPFIVFDDADLDGAVAGAMIAKMRNGGEACTAANRFFVQDGIADAFSKKFAAAMQAMRVGPGLEEGVDLGPLINKSAQNDMIAFVDDATAKGAKVVTGGQRPNRKGFFFQPTLLIDVPDEANVLSHEIFGPIAPMQRFSSTDEAIVKANGGTVVGAVRHPQDTADLSSFLFQAQTSKAKVIGLANAGGDTINSIKQANEFGIIRGGQKMIGLLTYISDVHGMGLQYAKGLILASAFYWDLTDETRAWTRRFMERSKKIPTMANAGAYGATLHYLKAIKEAGTDEAQAVVRKMKELPVNDFFTKGGSVREDGRVIRSMYLFQVKSPEESKYPYDYYKLLNTVSGEQAFRPLAEGGCPMVAKKS